MIRPFARGGGGVPTAYAPDGPLGTVAKKARELLGAADDGPTDATRTLPIFGTAEELEAAWQRETTRKAVLEGVTVDVEAVTMRFGHGRPGWGNEAHLDVRLTEPLPDLATGALAGKILRRFKSLVETGEIPTTSHNPAARGGQPEGGGRDGGAG